MARKRIGELLLERKAITEAQLEAALQQQQRTRLRLGAVLIAQGAITEKTLAHALSEALGVPVLDLGTRTPDWSAIHLLRVRFCEQHDLFPVALENAGGRRYLVVAMADPLDSAALQEMEFTTGLKVSPHVAPLSAVRSAIQRYYHRTPAPVAPRAPVPARPSLPATPVVMPEASEDDFDEIIVGEEVIPGEMTRRVSLEQLIHAREQESRRKRGLGPSDAKKPSAGDISADLDSLFGNARTAPASGVDPVEELERKFWVLMRIMARKGLLTNEEFTRELDDELEK